MFIREKKNVKTDNKKKVISIKEDRKAGKEATAVKAAVFGAFLDPMADDLSTQLSSVHNIHA